MTTTENKKGLSIFYEGEEQTQVYVHPELTYPEFLQLLSTMLLHGMNAYFQAFISTISKANLKTKIDANKKTALAHPISQEQVMSSEELDQAKLNAAYNIHDAANLMVSNALRMFLPDDLAFLDPESLITEEAILKAELEALNNHLADLSPAQQEVAKARVESIKEDLKRNKDEYAKMQMKNENTTDTE